MRVPGFLLCALLATSAYARIEPETIGQETLGTPQPTWLMVHDFGGAAYVFDAATGDMHGLLSLSVYTPAVATNLGDKEIYAAESFFSRGVHGSRSDVLTIYDLETLSPKAEVEIPQKIAALPYRQYIALLDDNRHVGVFNLTPAFSVSVVDVASQEFVGEISTPGCALVMQTPGRGFLQMCGDGTLQLIRLNGDGGENARVRSDAFFSVDDDPVFDKPVPTADGWLLISYGGKVFDVTVDGDAISISDPWSVVSDDDRAEKWGPGGGQLIAYHEGLDLMYVLMNQVGEFAHDSAGSEVWVFDRGAQRRIGRITLEHAGTQLWISQTDEPLLAVTGEDQKLHIFDGIKLTLTRSIAEAGTAPGLLQGF